MKRAMSVVGVFLYVCALSNISAFGQESPCPGTAVTFTSSNTPGGVLPAGTTLGLGITVNSGSSTYLTTAPDTTTYLVSSAPSGATPAPIIIDSNFKTNVGASGTVMIYLTGNCGENPQSIKDSAQAVAPATFSTEKPLLVYPTITTGQVTITGSNADLANAAIIVTDESGRSVYRMYNKGATTTFVSLNLGNLGNGLYFVRVATVSKIKVQKIIILK